MFEQNNNPKFVINGDNSRHILKTLHEGNIVNIFSKIDKQL